MRYPTESQRKKILNSFVSATTLQGAHVVTGLDREIVFKTLKAAEYRGELYRIRDGGKTYWVRRRF